MQVTGFGQRGSQPANALLQQGRGAATPTPTPTGTSSPTKGQNPPGPGQTPRPTPSAEQYIGGWDWWNDEAIKKELKLTDMQVRQITMLFDRRVRELTPTYDEFRKQRTELDRMTQERTVDEATYALQVSKVQFLQSKLNETRTVMLYAISRRLDQKQNEQLKVIRDRRFGRGGGAPIPRTW